MITFASIMQRLVKFILALVLVALVTGCGGMHRYDARLVAADSLMWTAPDSALAIVTAIDSLAGERDQAYRDLLATQARYKCYVEITARDDSAITRAMDYYRHHNGDREKLTRAYLYKGAIMEELAHIDSAMYYYKTAEVTADEKDYTNLGQINTRIADLYRRFYADEQKCFEKYNLAYKYYSLTGNEQLQYDCLFGMFMMAGVLHNDQYEELYRHTLDFSKKLRDDKKVFEVFELRCRQLSQSDSTQNEAKQIALMCLNDYSQYITNDLLLDLANLYTKENKLDSAKLFINCVDVSLSPGDEQRINIRKHEILSRIASLEGKTEASSSYLVKTNTLVDSILNNTDKYRIQQIEESINNQQYELSQSRINYLHWALAVLGIICILPILFMFIVNKRRQRRTQEIIEEIQKSQIDTHDVFLSQINDRNGVVERLFINMIALMKSYSGNGVQNSSSKFEEQIRETIVNVANDDFWNELSTYLDKKYNGLISSIAINYSLKQKDIKFIELICCGFTNLEIAIIMGYALKYISNKRKILAQKMHLNTSLNEFLNHEMALYEST